MNEVAVRVAPELDAYRAVGMARALAQGKDPKGPLGAAYFLCAYYAEQMGLSPLAGLELSLIDGKIVVSVKLLRALARERGIDVLPEGVTDEEATAVVIDRSTGEEIGRSTFTIDEAQAAGLVKERGSWVTWPRRMLWARAAGFAIADYAPHVSVGLLTEAEAEEIAGGDTPPPVEATSEPPGVDDDPDPDVVDAEVVDVDVDVAEAAAWETAQAAQEAEKARRRHFATLERLKNDERAVLPDRFDAWEEVSVAMFSGLFPDLESRGELDAAGWDRLTDEVEAQAVPFG